MNIKDWLIPGITIVFAAGISVATEDLSKRVVVLESKSGKQEVVDIKIEGVETRLDKMEVMMGKMLEVQQKQAISQAKICQATNADCD